VEKAWNPPPLVSTELYTRTYRVDPNMVVQNLEAIAGGVAGQLTRLTRGNESTVQKLLRDYFAAVGVDFSDSASAGTNGSPPRVKARRAGHFSTTATASSWFGHGRRLGNRRNSRLGPKRRPAASRDRGEVRRDHGNARQALDSTGSSAPSARTADRNPWRGKPRCLSRHRSGGCPRSTNAVKELRGRPA